VIQRSLHLHRFLARLLCRFRVIWQGSMTVEMAVVRYLVKVVDLVLAAVAFGFAGLLYKFGIV